MSDVPVNELPSSELPSSELPSSELGDQAQQLLNELTLGMTPSAADEARAFDRLTDGLAAQANARPFHRRVIAFLHGLGAHLWRIAIPIAVLAGTMFIARALMRNELGDAAALQEARALLQQQRYRGAYQVLSKHADAFKGREAAEARTPLVLDALCGMGDRDKAQVYLERYLAFEPDSPLADRQRDVCPLGTEPARRVE